MRMDNLKKRARPVEYLSVIPYFRDLYEDRATTLEMIELGLTMTSYRTSAIANRLGIKPGFDSFKDGIEPQKCLQ